MKSKTHFLLAGLLGLLFSVVILSANTAVIPQARDWPPAAKLHQEYLALAQQGGINVLFVGDSITAGWRGPGKAIWNEHFAPLHAANFGIGGDRTQNVLWRLSHGELDGIHPKVVVLMIGTNNLGFEYDGATVRNTPVEAIEGVKAVVALLREKLPAAKILLLGIFPRGEKGSPERGQIAEVNAAISKLDDGKFVHYLDIGQQFLYPDGTLPHEFTPDLCHPNEVGYAIWARAIDKPLAELLK